METNLPSVMPPGWRGSAQEYSATLIKGRSAVSGVRMATGGRRTSIKQADENALALVSATVIQ